MKSTKKAKADVVNIDEIAKLYRTFALEEKEAKQKSDEYKKQIIEYAKGNPDKFDGKNLKLPSGVRVEIRTSVKTSWSDDACTLEWLSKAIESGLGDAISVKIDPKSMPESLKKTQEKVLNAIDYCAEAKDTYAVCLD